MYGKYFTIEKKNLFPENFFYYRLCKQLGFDNMIINIILKRMERYWVSRENKNQYLSFSRISIFFPSRKNCGLKFKAKSRIRCLLSQKRNRLIFSPQFNRNFLRSHLISMGDNLWHVTIFYLVLHSCSAVVLRSFEDNKGRWVIDHIFLETFSSERLRKLLFYGLLGRIRLV